LGEELDAAKAELDTLLAEIRDIALTIPNLPADEVPVGKDENDMDRQRHDVSLFTQVAYTDFGEFLRNAFVDFPVAFRFPGRIYGG
ncbi:hypothetical protein ONJ87_26575, partial [Salmonella enterica subsp. enterica serovar Anatum]|nr:hypothetical protein [Salmonella enterica subsp. enterica serovar Anatum]